MKAGENRTGKQEGRIVPPDFAVPAETAERTSSDRKAGHRRRGGGEEKKGRYARTVVHDNDALVTGRDPLRPSPPYTGCPVNEIVR